jgi:hypothetical protein
MSTSATPDEARPAPGGQGSATAWECFYRSIRESLDVRPQVLPMPPGEDPGDPAVRMMQRARRHTWLHARYDLHWSMFESIRLSVRLAEAFAEWTRADAPDLEVLAGLLEQVEREARALAPVSEELRFVDRLLDVATATDLHLAEMDLAMEAFARTDAPGRRTG